MSFASLPGPGESPGRPAPLRSFCGYCGHAADVDEPPPSRVCDRCEMGLLLQTAATAVPDQGDAFVVVDDLLSIRAVSRQAERLLAASENTLVGRHVGEALVPADLVPTGASVAALVVRAMRQHTVEESVTIRPRGAFGIRFSARIAACEPGPAALIVLTEQLSPAASDPVRPGAPTRPARWTR